MPLANIAVGAEAEKWRKTDEKSSNPAQETQEVGAMSGEEPPEEMLVTYTQVSVEGYADQGQDTDLETGESDCTSSAVDDTRACTKTE